jgi:lipoprotein NlpD
VTSAEPQRPRASRATHALVTGLAALLTACAQSGAPVVDKPVSDWSRSATTQSGPAAPASAPAGTPAARQAAGKADSPAASEADWRPDVYVVKRGDTLYTIALDHGQSYRDVAAWNSIADPNLIHAGQQLRVRPPPGWSEPVEAEEQVVTQPMPPPPALEATPLEPPAPPPLKTGPKAVKLAYSEKALAQAKGVPYKEPVAAATVAPPKPAPAATAPAASSTAPAASPGTPAARPAASAAQANPATATSPKTAPRPAGSDLARGWAWPASGPLLHPFNSGANPKGIAIGGQAGQPVLAAAPGKVVYSGSGLRGYGKLIIIKHDDTYLSVYAHNREILVKEGQRVAQGQKIAEMGSSEADRVRLHFEIRRLGQPVDPLQYLPASGA